MAILFIVARPIPDGLGMPEIINEYKKQPHEAVWFSSPYSVYSR